MSHLQRKVMTRVAGGAVGGPLVHLPFNTDLLEDRGSLGLTWTNPDSKLVLSSTRSKFGGFSAYRALQDSTAGLVASAYPIDLTQDCTIEFWLIALNSGGTRQIITSNNGANQRGINILCFSSGQIVVRLSGSLTTGQTNAPIGVEGSTTPVFISVTYKAAAKELLLHQDGIYIDKASGYTGDFNPTTFDILGDGNNLTTGVAVSTWMDNFKIWPSALYSETNFTPPTEE